MNTLQQQLEDKVKDREKMVFSYLQKKLTVEELSGLYHLLKAKYHEGYIKALTEIIEGKL